MFGLGLLSVPSDEEADFAGELGDSASVAVVERFAWARAAAFLASERARECLLAWPWLGEEVFCLSVLLLSVFPEVD